MTAKTPVGSAISHKIDLDAYFRRIGYTGARDNSLDTLRAIHLAHVNAIPFENLNPLSGLPVNIDPESIQRKLVHENRGGYCFEHNHLFMAVLEELGFQVKPLAARVMWNLPAGTVTPRGHMLLLVIANGSHYIADTGFGGLTLPLPILLKENILQMTTHEQFRLIENSGEYFLQANINQEWKTLYRFYLHEQYHVDYEVTNYFLSTNPVSHFTYTLLAARVDGDRRLALRNNEFAIHHNGNTTRRRIDSLDDLVSVLETHFRIRIPMHERVTMALAKVIERRRES